MDDRNFDPLDFMVGFGEDLPRPSGSPNLDNGPRATKGDWGMPYSRFKDQQNVEQVEKVVVSESPPKKATI